jgi:hypothetical protein
MKSKKKPQLEIELVNTSKLNLEFKRNVSDTDCLKILDDIMGDIPVNELSIAEIENEINKYDLPAVQQKIVAMYIVNILGVEDGISEADSYTRDYLVNKLQSYKKYTREEFEYQMNLQIKHNFIKTLSPENINDFPSSLIDEFTTFEGTEIKLLQNKLDNLYKQIENCNK